MNKKVILISLATILTIVITLVIMGVSTSNKEILLRTRISSQEKVREAYFDKMWKILKQKAGVTTQYKDSFKEIYVGVMEGRYSHGAGQMMNWIKEANPNFDASLYKDLMTSIEAQRTGFFMEQKVLIDLNNEHNLLLKQFPGSMFVGDRPEINIKVISSTKSKKVIETGVEDDVELF